MSQTLRIEFTAGGNTLTAYPKNCTISASVCSQDLQHQEDSVSATLVYDPELFQLLALNDTVSALVYDGTERKFTGRLSDGFTWNDIGEPYPVDSIVITIKDNTYKLDCKTATEIGFINASLGTIIHRLCADCGIEFSSESLIPESIILPAFIIEAQKSYKEIVNTLLFEYGYSFYFDASGKLAVFDFKTVQATATLSETQILTKPKISRQNKNYTKVTIKYDTLVKKTNELVYFSGSGYNSDATVAPVVVQPGVYYPFDADPVVEADEGQVYQEFQNGYAETKTKYNGEKKYQRSGDTSLVYTKNHVVTADWNGNIQINRTDFGFRRASVRLYNAGVSDAHVYSISIRADAWYRGADCSYTAGSGDSEYTCETQFVFTASVAKTLGDALYKFFSRGKFSIQTETEFAITPGSYRTIVTGLSGFSATALAISSSYDPEKELWTTDFITVGTAAVDTARAKRTLTQGLSSSIAAAIADIVSGDADVPAPGIPTGICAVPNRDNITLTCSAADNGLGNIIKKYVWQVKKRTSLSWDTASAIESPSTQAVFPFIRSGINAEYLEASALAGWSVRAKTINQYGKESAWSEEVALTLTTYGTWIPAAPTTPKITADRDFLTLSWSYTAPTLYYGNIKFIPVLSYNGCVRSGIPESYTKESKYIFNRTIDGYPEKTAITGVPYLGDYSLSVTAINTESGAKTVCDAEETALDVSNYKTWIPAIPTVAVRCSNRTVTLGFASQSLYVYGDIAFDVQIGKCQITDGNDTEVTDWSQNWHTPATDDSRIRNVSTAFSKILENGTEKQNGYVYHYGDFISAYTANKTEPLRVTGFSFSQSLPLDQVAVIDEQYNSTGDLVTRRSSYAIDTAYRMRVRAVSLEAGHISMYSGENEMGTVVQATATSAVDVVNNAISTAQIVNDSITAQKLFVSALAAISANLGQITDGALTGNENNYWILTNGEYADGNGGTVTRYAGDFRVGGSNGTDYIQCSRDPDDPNKYAIAFHASSFEITALGTLVRGGFFVAAQSTAVGADGAPASYYLKIDKASGNVHMTTALTVTGNMSVGCALTAASVTASGNVKGATGTITGALTAASVTASGNVKGATGTITGALTAESVTAKFYDQTYQTLDLASLNHDLYYPVTGFLNNHGYTHIQVNVQLNSGTTPSWSTHSQGFSCNLSVYAKASGWGTTGAGSYCDDYSYTWASANPCGFSQMTHSSNAVLWLRGGGKYYVVSNKTMSWVLHTSSYEVCSQTVTPQTTNPGLNFAMATITARCSAIPLTQPATVVDGSIWITG